MVLRIGEVARKAGVSVKTLHYYEEWGLVQPAQRTEAGHRLYGENEVVRMTFIVRAKRLGLSLEEIAELLESWSENRRRKTREHLRRLMQAKLEELRCEIEELSVFETQLEEAYESLANQPRTNRAPRSAISRRRSAATKAGTIRPRRYGPVRSRARSIVSASRDGRRSSVPRIAVQRCVP